jgi:hypothetical protein
MLTLAIREVLTDQQATPAQVENLRQTALYFIDHGTDSADEIRIALRDVLDRSNRPAARSWQTDSGLGASRAR